MSQEDDLQTTVAGEVIFEFVYKGVGCGRGAKKGIFFEP
jgi:hypothetical protein